MQFKDLKIGQLFYIDKTHVGSLSALYVKRGENTYSQSLTGTKSLFYTSEIEQEVWQLLDINNQPVIMWVL